MSVNFGSKDGILIRTMTVEDYKQIDGNVFKDEPLKSSLDKEPKEIEEARKKRFDDYHIRLIENGTCLAAINENDNGRVVGVVLAYGQVPSDMKNYHKSAISNFLSEAEVKANLFARYEVSNVLISHITNVDASMRGKGIGSRLAVALMELGRSQGYPLMAAFCTSFYSARQNEALGMECVYSQAYADYKDENGKVVFNPPAPHTHLRIMAIKL
ncbi:dopamine N-acetyltransferase-like [Drosophila innubila]|uniref:dopamine N-acetyltransferase-like n=1 Tax=Drosophila innubila TaxID=198719 RepID=UPI00148C5730|nr:dopamine N-acetyltransferase-like [Drosophila innubila]